VRRRVARPGRRCNLTPRGPELKVLGLGSRGTWSWVLAAFVFLGVGIYVALPAFQAERPVPRPWSLWLSTNALTIGGLNEPNWLLRMTTKADRDCHTATVIGALQWKIQEVNSVVTPEPNRYILGVEGVRVLSLETRGIDHLNPALTQQWHTTPMSQVQGAYVAEVRAPLWPNNVEPAEFRMKITAAHSAGVRSCYLTSPGLGEAREGAPPEEESNLDSAVGTFADSRHDPSNFIWPIALDAVDEMSVPGQEPEAAATNAALAEQPGAAVTTCSTHPAGPLIAHGEIDRFGEYRQSRAKRPCAGVWRFQTRDRQAFLSGSTFISGILLGGALGILITAAMGFSVVVSAVREWRATGRA
jgi:hypothetical protein